VNFPQPPCCILQYTKEKYLKKLYSFPASVIIQNFSGIIVNPTSEVRMAAMLVLLKYEAVKYKGRWVPVALRSYQVS
jgi:hypothetical protein